MIGLGGARVIVVDDDQEEAIPILKALSRQGVAAAYFDGQVSGLPAASKKLRGVRLAVLDMDIIGGGSPTKSNLSALVNFLKGILSEDNGPYGIIVWTKHADVVPDFERYLFAARKFPRPVFLVTLDKEDFRAGSGNFKLSALSPRIKSLLNELTPLAVLLAWEEMSFRAAAEVTNGLSKLAVADATDLATWRSQWKGRLDVIMRTLADAEAGKLLSSNTVLQALYSCMNPLHADRMESLVALPAGQWKAASDEILASTGTCDDEAVARINTLLHLSLEGPSSFYAGAMYYVGRGKRPEWATSSKEFLTELMQRVQVKPDADEAARAAAKAKEKEQLAAVMSSCRPLLMEVSASCDHTQLKVRMARFILGLAIPVAERTAKRVNQKPGPGVWKLGPVYLASEHIPANSYDLIFSARFMVTVDVKHAKKLRPVARLRSQAFVEMQAWLGHHTARPGMLLL